MNQYLTDKYPLAQLWHFTGNTPRKPAQPRAGENVTLWFGTSPIQPSVEVFVVVETDRADDLDEPPRVVKAIRDHDRDNNSYWRCEIEPANAGDTVAYFAVACHEGRELVCGKQHWFLVCSGGGQ